MNRNKNHIDPLPTETESSLYNMPMENKEFSIQRVNMIPYDKYLNPRCFTDFRDKKM